MLKIKIYYEDTDLGGVVYYANYLKYFERGRTEFLADRGVDLAAYHRQGVIFAVRNVFVDYLGPARYGDILTINTELIKCKKASMNFGHTIIKNGGETIVTGSAKLVCITDTFKPRRIPQGVMETIDVQI